jgi:hypothetical protein
MRWFFFGSVCSGLPLGDEAEEFQTSVSVNPLPNGFP